MRKLFTTVLAIFALALGGYAGWRQFTPPPPVATLAQIQFPDVEKKLRSGDEWLGKIVVVNHWATWCPPCVEEIPMLIDAQKRFAERGVQVVGISHDLLEPTREFGARFGINYPSLVAIAGGRDIMLQHGSGGGFALPFTVFFDRDGNLAARHLGQLTQRELERALQKIR